MSLASSRRAASLTLTLFLALSAQAQVTTPPATNPPATSPASALADPLPAGGTPAPAPVTDPAPAPAPAIPAAPASGFKTNPPVPLPTPPVVTPPPVTPPVVTPPVVTPPMPTPPSLPPVAVRGLWVDAFGAGLKTRAQITQMVQDAARMNINVLFVQAIRRGDCLCLKSGLPLATDRDLEKNFDPLAFATRLAHEKGIRVIAWASVTGIANTASPSTNPQHVMRTHGPASRDSWLARRSDGTWQEGSDGWLDAGIPAAADYAAQAVANLVRNYDVDGVQLDRIRYPDGGDWGYDPKTIARYNAETGNKGRPLPSDPAWQQWKRDQITALVRRIALEVKSARPTAWMSAATITYGSAPRPLDPNSFRQSRPYNDVMQDWPTWIYTGLIDLNVPMNYKRDLVGDQAVWFNGWNSYASSVRTRADGQVSPLAIGTALYLNSPEVSASQALRSTQAGLGWVGYSYRAPTLDVYNDKQTLAQGLDTIRAALSTAGEPLASSQRWTENPPSSRGLMGRVVGVTWPGGRTVQAWQGGKLVASSLTDGNGYYGFLTLPAGKTEIRVGNQRWVDTIPERGVVRLPDLLLR